MTRRGSRRPTGIYYSFVSTPFEPRIELIYEVMCGEVGRQERLVEFTRLQVTPELSHDDYYTPPNELQDLQISYRRLDRLDKVDDGLFNRKLCLRWTRLA